MTPHPTDGFDSEFNATVHVIDLKLSGTIEDPDSKLSIIVGALLSMTDDVGVVGGGEKAGTKVVPLL